MNTLSNYPAKHFIGVNNGENIYLTAPAWDCGWYWGFGYLGNNNCHYHVDGLNDDKNQNMFDAFREHFGATFKITDRDLWTLCELFKTFYTLRQTAEVLGRGGSHYTRNPCAEIIMNPVETQRINNEVLPEIFEAIYKVLLNAKDNLQTEREEKKQALLDEAKKKAEQSEIRASAEILLIENDIPTDNFIFYKHIGRFCFGWRTGLTDDYRKELYNDLLRIGFALDRTDFKMIGGMTLPAIAPVETAKAG